MPLFEWSAEYELGVPEIDKDRKRVLAYISFIHLEWQGAGRGDVILGALNELHRHGEAAAEREEALHTKVNYADREVHAYSHELLLGKLGALTRAYEREGADFDFRPLMQFITKWGANHILQEDLHVKPSMTAKRGAGTWSIPTTTAPKRA